jgi:heat shock protein 5
VSCLSSFDEPVFSIFFYSGKSESITITNENGRLSKDDIDRMIREAEEFASEDEAARKRIEALNALSSFVYGLKTQIGDQHGLGAKISDADRKTLLAETTEWIDSEGQTASAESLKEKLAELQAVVNPITSKLYEDAGPGGYGPGEGDEQEPFRSHDEL